MPQLVADLRAGTLEAQYRATDRPDITRVPAPRWYLVNFKYYVTMAVQFSRGWSSMKGMFGTDAEWRSGGRKDEG